MEAYSSNARDVVSVCTVNTEHESTFATPRIFVHRTITSMYTSWETHGARVVDSSNENIMECSKQFYEGQKDSW